ncbi:hypothetical protein VTJ83DRAFT_4613 [Remersonia thermophila]|uniref:Heterokaryon incompatibility domain-containing protein n=1 Tax=Remersonia thermophila TaxID=72144 RepID=A0ABR4DBX5_9PEZI
MLRATSSVWNIKWPFRSSPGGVVGQFMIAKRAPEDNEDQPDHYLVETEKNPPSNRGWTVQERVLSRSTVLFGQRQMHWECASGRWSESTRMRPVRFENHVLQVGLPFAPLPKFGSGPVQDQDELLEGWYRILRVFTLRELTKKTDKLPTLSGIAKLVRQGFGDNFDTTCQDGLWSHDFPRAILWTSRDAATDILSVAWENIVLDVNDSYGPVKEGT